MPVFLKTAVNDVIDATTTVDIDVFFHVYTYIAVEKIKKERYTAV